MFFDTLAGVVERHLPDWIPVLKKARIFRLQPRAATPDETQAAQRPDALAEAMRTWEPDTRIVENFRLPFDTVAIEYAATRTSPSDRGLVVSVKGNPGERRFSFIGGRKDIIATGTFKAFSEDEEEVPANRITQMEELTTYQGDKRGLIKLESRLAWTTDLTDPGEWHDRIDPDLYASWEHYKDNPVAGRAALVAKYGEAELQSKLTAILDNAKKFVTRLACRNTKLLCDEVTLTVLTINTPSQFIVEERPLIPRGQSNLPVVRSVDRPHFIVLTPADIRKRFIRPEGQEDEAEEAERRKVGAHERRGHFRTLRSERFTKAKGQVIWIEPIWIGPSEATVGPNKYKVRLDL